MPRLSKLSRLVLVGIVILAPFTSASPAGATAPPPASNLCAIISGLCDAAPAPLPDFRFTVRSGSTSRTVTSNTELAFPVTLKVTNVSDEFTLSSVRFYDAKNVLPSGTTCYAFRTNLLSPGIGVKGPASNPNVPWKQAVNNEPWGPSFGPSSITFTNIPRNKLNKVQIGISCDYLGQTYRRSVLFSIQGFDDTVGGVASMTFHRVNPTPIDRTSAIQTGTALLWWTIRNNVGVCTITEVRSDGDYQPPISRWGTDAYIKANLGSSLGVGLTVDYPAVPGSNRYTFTMKCSNVTNPIDATITATRTNSGGGGGGSSQGKVLDYGRGTQRF